MELRYYFIILRTPSEKISSLAVESGKHQRLLKLECGWLFIAGVTCARDAAELRDRDKRFSSAIFTLLSGRFLLFESLQASSVGSRPQSRRFEVFTRPIRTVKTASSANTPHLTPRVMLTPASGAFDNEASIKGSSATCLMLSSASGHVLLMCAMVMQFK